MHSQVWSSLLAKLHEAKLPTWSRSLLIPEVAGLFGNAKAGQRGPPRPPRLKRPSRVTSHEMTENAKTLGPDSETIKSPCLALFLITNFMIFMPPAVRL